jgi:hypothetical protein
MLSALLPTECLRSGQLAQDVQKLENLRQGVDLLHWRNFWKRKENCSYLDNQAKAGNGVEILMPEVENSLAGAAGR